MFLSVPSKVRAFSLQKCAHGGDGDRPPLYRRIEVNQVRVSITQQGALRFDVKGDDRRTDKGFYPTARAFPIYTILDQWDCLRLNTLYLEWRDLNGMINAFTDSRHGYRQAALELPGNPWLLARLSIVVPCNKWASVK